MSKSWKITIIGIEAGVGAFQTSIIRYGNRTQARTQGEAWIRCEQARGKFSDLFIKSIKRQPLPPLARAFMQKGKTRK